MSSLTSTTSEVDPLSEVETLSLFKNLILHIYNRARSISYFLALIVLCECEAKTPKG